MSIKKLNPQQLQTLLIVNNSAYATHQKTKIGDWLKVKKIFRTDQTAISAMMKYGRLTPKNTGIVKF